MAAEPEKKAPRLNVRFLWGWTVNDPMGETIEFDYSPAVQPEVEEPVWPA